MKPLSHRQETKWSVKSTFEKKLRQLFAELEVLWKKRADMPSIPLDEPIANGWTKEFVLREDIARRFDANVIEAILEAINSRIWSKTPDFTYKGRKGVRKPIQHFIRHIPMANWLKGKKDKTIPDTWNKFFVSENHVWRNGRGAYVIEKVMAFRWPWFFVPGEPKVRWLTHYTDVDGALEEKRAEIYQWFDQNHAWAKWSHLHGHRANGEHDWDHEKDKIAENELNKYLNEGLLSYLFEVEDMEEVLNMFQNERRKRR